RARSPRLANLTYLERAFGIDAGSIRIRQMPASAGRSHFGGRPDGHTYGVTPSPRRWRAQARTFRRCHRLSARPKSRLAFLGNRVGFDQSPPAEKAKYRIRIPLVDAVAPADD